MNYRWMTKTDVAQRWGVSVRTIERAIARGKLPAEKLKSGDVRIASAAADRLVVGSDQLFTIAQLARLWNVREGIIRADIRKGALAVIRLPVGGIRIAAAVARTYGPRAIT